MTDFLAGLAALTLSGSLVVGLLGLFSRSARTRFGARWRCWAWLLLCLRLAVPFHLPFLDQSRSQPLVQLPAPSDTIIYQRPAPSPPVSQPSASQPPPTEPSQPQSPAPAESQSRPLTLSHVLTFVWITGVAVLLLWSILAHLRFLTYLRRWAVPLSDAQTVALYNQLGDQLGLDRRPKLMTCPGLPAPMLAGLFHPVLLLPQEVPSETALNYSLLHELTHYRRRDVWLKALALWVNALHWFNPLVWYMVRLVDRDTELACDEAALTQLPRDQHAAYGRTILDAAARVRGNI